MDNALCVTRSLSFVRTQYAFCVPEVAGYCGRCESYTYKVSLVTFEHASELRRQHTNSVRHGHMYVCMYVPRVAVHWDVRMYTVRTVGEVVGCDGRGGEYVRSLPVSSGTEVMGWAEPGEEGRVWVWGVCVGNR